MTKCMVHSIQTSNCYTGQYIHALVEWGGGRERGGVWGGVGCGKGWGVVRGTHSLGSDGDLVDHTSNDLSSVAGSERDNAQTEVK